MSNKYGENTSRRDIIMVEPNMLKADEAFNARLDYGDINGLAASIVANGVFTPLRGRRLDDGSFLVTDGHRRLRAITKAIELGADLKRVPFVLEPKTATDEDRSFALFICNDGQPLNMLEQALLVKRLTDYGHKPDEIALKIGRSNSFVGALLKLAAAPKKIHDEIMSGKISSTLALEIIREEKDGGNAVGAVETAISNAKEKGKEKATKKDKAPSSRQTKERKEKEKTDQDIVSDRIKVLQTIISKAKGEDNVTATMRALVGYLTSEVDENELTEALRKIRSGK